MNRIPAPLDHALAFLVVLPVVLAPAYFFTRMESAREQAAFEDWRGMAVSRAVSSNGIGNGPLPGGADSGLDYSFQVAEGGVDEFGISRESGITVIDATGTRAEPDQARDSILTEAAGVVRSLPMGVNGTCTSRDGEIVVCGVRSNCACFTGKPCRFHYGARSSFCSSGCRRSLRSPARPKCGDGPRA
ncbi:MAG: hypothetical protein GXP54_09255 [Deltaproteobacteria bacterium]|nr:hypothetical protein [Deltaproteobacteria bacterium]